MAGRRWTEKDLDFLEKHARLKTCLWMSKRLGRTQHAVNRKLQILYGSWERSSGHLNLRDVAKIYGTEYYYVRRLAEVGIIPAKVVKRRDGRIGRWAIDPADLPDLESIKPYIGKAKNVYWGKL